MTNQPTGGNGSGKPDNRPDLHPSDFIIVAALIALIEAVFGKKKPKA
jgi:hypothetical protein